MASSSSASLYHCWKFFILGFSPKILRKYAPMSPALGLLRGARVPVDDARLNSASGCLELPNPIWNVITELCVLFRAIFSKVLHVDNLIQLQTSIVETICKLEKVFLPGFFDSM
ncbi:hypothetical protein OSB04_007126 [Centaurea solstitialis]|uniref:DUF4218 domain-containing protein n=1 Tax=Centaurea solstitialis TaxID=347529 RepID=A0AA38WT43_9ASTR|nr:hypothetical protein OSB04_007126 [Centaurea solstitialis]